MSGLVLCLLAAKFLFQVPFRGSVAVLVGVSMLYLLVALGIGLLISSAVKSQFVASQIALLVTFLPALMLSGFLFDLRSMPAIVRVITYVLPARYYVTRCRPFFWLGISGQLFFRMRWARRNGGGVTVAHSKSDSEKNGMRQTMLDSIFRILALTHKELLAILKDPRSRFSLIPPILQCLIVPGTSRLMT